MRKGFYLLCLLFSNLIYCQQTPSFKNIPVDTNFVFRGLSVVDDSIAWLSGIKGVVGRSTNGGNTWSFTPVKGFEKWDFRTLFAFNSQEAVIANAGSPAFILRTSNGGVNWNIVYANKDSMAFFDGVDFWNDKEGIIYGDPIKGRMLLLKTADGGKTWQELPEESRPLMSEGEASFAASGTGIRCYEESKIIFATGGKLSRLIISYDKGKHWFTIKTPMVQGKNGTGIFSLAFSGNDSMSDTERVLVIVGGDYMIDTLKVNHVFYAQSKKMGSFNFKAPMKLTGGYRECVEFISLNTAIAVGPGGADISYDRGINWEPIPEKGFHVIRKARKGKLILAAGSKKISILR